MTTLNIPTYGNNYRKLNNHFEELKVVAQEVPNRSVKVNPGVFWRGNQVVEFTGSNSLTFENPTSPNNAKFDIVVIDQFNKISIISGTESNTQAEIPFIPEDVLPLAAVYLKSNTTNITSSMIFDLRPFLNIKSFNLDHNSLLNKNIPNQHNISDITDLELQLNSKTNKVDFENFVLSTNNTLSSKSESTGTDSNEFQLNHSYTGVPSTDCIFSVNRGSLQNVGIKWSESTNQWEYTNDGITWHPFNNSVNNSSPATNSVLGLVRLSVESLTPTTPTVVETTDPRLLTEVQKDQLLNSLIDSVESVSGKTGVVVLNKTDVGLDQVDNTSDVNKPISTAMQLALNNKVDRQSNKQLSTEDFTTYEKNKLANIEAEANKNTVTSVAGKTGVISLDKADVGLALVDNTSDLNKPISNAVQLALDSLDSKYISKTIANDHLLLKDKVVAGNIYRIEVHNGVINAILV